MASFLVKGVNNVTRKWDPSIRKFAMKTIGTSFVLSCLSSQVFAAAFQLNEHNALNLGLAYSGTAALAEDATTGFYNPAGLVRIPDGQIVLSGVLIQSSSDFYANRAVSPTGVVLGAGDANPGTVAGIPSFHLAKRLDESFAVGFNVTVPFGLSVRYGEDSIARYVSTDSEIATTNLEASIAMKIVPCFSIAAGPDAMYGKATLNVRTQNTTNVGVVPFLKSQDGFQRNEADGWAWGWHAGMLWEPTENTRVGFNYRSNFVLRLNGNTESLGLASLPAPFGSGEVVNSISRVRSRETFPELATFSFYHRFACMKELAMTGDLSWTNWSRIRTLRLRYARPIPTNISGALLPDYSKFAVLTPDSDFELMFRDSKRYALGFIYTICDAWLLRFGGAFEETPVRNEYRTAAVPDSDRIWAAAGAAYTYKNWRIDFGYAHLFFTEASMNDHSPFTAQSNIVLRQATLSGDYNTSANLFGLQVRYDFV